MYVICIYLHNITNIKKTHTKFKNAHCTNKTKTKLNLFLTKRFYSYMFIIFINIFEMQAQDLNVDKLLGNISSIQ